MSKQVDDLYTGVTQEALIMGDGDFQKADYLLDCSWYEYMYRKDNHRKYGEWYAKQLKGSTGKK